MLAMRTSHSRDPCPFDDSNQVEFFVSVRTADCTTHDDSFQRQLMAQINTLWKSYSLQSN
jgi:hypothetical protein